MKKKTILGVLVALFLPVLLWAGVANAQDFRSGNHATVQANETIESTLFISGRNIDIAGTVDGDVFCAGMNITITGTVKGDVMCAGQTVRVAGIVEGDIRVAGQTVVVGERVQGAVTAGAQNFTLERSANVDRDVTVGATDAVINGSLGRDLVLGADSATVSALIGRNVEAGADRLSVSDRTQIGGNLAYTSNHKAQIAAGAQIEGETTHKTPKKQDDKRWGISKGFGFLVVLYFLLAMLVLALVLALLFPRIFWRATDTGMESFGKVFLVGLIASLVFPPVFFILLFTIIGIPLAFFLALLWLVILTLSGPFFAFYIGRRLMTGRNTTLTMLVGGLIVLLLYLIPIVGFIVLLLSHWTGTGMLLTSMWQRRSMASAREHQAAEVKEILAPEPKEVVKPKAKKTKKEKK